MLNTTLDPADTERIFRYYASRRRLRSCGTGSLGTLSARSHRTLKEWSELNGSNR
jgi:hypothetical protein